jgi:nicotinamidase-related amidase
MAPSEDGYSGFQGRDSAGMLLGDRLRQHGVERIFVGGLATDYCVKQTVLDGLSQGFKVMVIGDAVRGVDLNPNDSVQALKEMSEAGAVMLAGIENLHVTG